MKEQIAKLRSIKTEVDTLTVSLKKLGEQDKKAPLAELKKLKELAGRLDKSAREAAQNYRTKLIQDLTKQIDEYSALLTLSLSTESRERVKSERATLKAQRAFHLGRQGVDFQGIISKDEVESLESLINEVKEAAAAKKKAAEYIDLAIKIGVGVTKVLSKVIM